MESYWLAAGRYSPAAPDAADSRSLGKAFAGRAAPAVAEAAAEVRRVLCPGCETAYGLPPGLLPPWGGRIHCPRCAAEFSVGVLAEADGEIESIRARNADGWQRACREGSLWGSFGTALLEAYQRLRERHGVELGSRAFRRALEAVAPGVPWLAPPTPPSPLDPVPDGSATLFERRREGGA